MAAFKDSFLTFLGPAFLKEFYSDVVRDPSGLALIADTGSQPLGFIVGSWQPHGFYKRILARRWWRFGLAAIGPFLHRPKIGIRLLRAFLKPWESMPVSKCGTLLSIAVTPGTQNAGVGQALLQSFIQEARDCGEMEFLNLTTDAKNNEHANHFYQKAGFQRVRKLITPEGRVLNEYLLPLHGVRLPAEIEHQIDILNLNPAKD